jgi:hypothetical protein
MNLNITELKSYCNIFVLLFLLYGNMSKPKRLPLFNGYFLQSRMESQTSGTEQKDSEMTGLLESVNFLTRKVTLLDNLKRIKKYF